MDKLLATLEHIRPECHFVESQDFILDGLLDSLDIVTLVAELEKQFGISIAGEDVTPEHFKNLETLDRFVHRLSLIHI